MLDGDRRIALSSPFSNAASDWCTGGSFMKTSVLPHHTITRRSQPLSGLELPDVGDQLFGQILLVLALLDVRTVEAA